jgi:hypothetical protein
MLIARRFLPAVPLLLAGAALLLPGCGDDNPLAPSTDGDLPDEYFDKSLEIIFQSGHQAPAEQASVSLGAESLPFWPYTGRDYEEQPVDPINLVFAGEADPLQIRAALLALDGDRTAFGFPDAPPFNETWLDALGGDVQTTYSVTGDGWVGSVVQLTLGDYGPIRFHLRLFRTGNACGTGCWTLGGAHFEMQIPGTTDHQVLSWELAEQLVVADLMRTGLLDQDLPLQPTGVINAAPSWRAIPAMIYNLLPPELVALVAGPDQPVEDDVPLASDGQGTILNLAQAAPVVPATYTATATVDFDQLIPRPYCADGPGDWLLATGPVHFTLTTAVTGALRFRSQSSYAGDLMIQAMDLSSGEPVPVGEPFPARVSGLQHGNMSAFGSRILSIDRRFTREEAGPQVLVERLVVPEHGLKTYHRQTRCIDD